jgi:hypothetical protein
LPFDANHNFSDSFNDAHDTDDGKAIANKAVSLPVNLQ